MPDYWIKLYHEILDDPKMATLPDRLWRRTIEVFLIAGKLSHDKSGQLPDTNQIAWLLRMTTDDLLMDMTQLSNAGIIKKNNEGWKVVNFEKRQSAVSNAERIQQYRDRKRKQEYYGDVTNVKRNVTQINRVQNTETDTEENNSDGDRFSSVQKQIEQLTGHLPNGAKGINAIQEIVDMGAIDEDIKAGFEWRRDNGKPTIYYQTLVNPIRTAMSIRLQEKIQTNRYEGAKVYE